MIVAPCTGNTLAKVASGISDTAATMAIKAHLRCDRPIILAVSSNDALSRNLANISKMLMHKSVYLVPMRQDDPRAKPHSLVADLERIPEAIAAAAEGRQLRPLFV
jgi:dipicolinate synthase subunit B